jgi:hypothetical protein
VKENEIIERLEALVKNGFPFCADALNLINHLKELDKKNENIIRLADKTIKSQSAEIERLKEGIQFERERVNAIPNLIKAAKSEAYKEVLERVRRLWGNYDGYEFETKFNNLVKEMVGDDNA